MILKASFFFLFLGLALARYFIVGPAQLKLLSVNPCSEYSNLPMQLVIKTKMFNKTTQLFDGFLSLPMDVNENVTLYVKSSRIDKRKSQVNSFVINDAEACTSLTKYVGNLWIDFQSQIGMEPGVCPIKKGNYSAKNIYLDMNKLNVQMLLEGEFKSRVIFKNATKPIYCSDLTIQLAPKENK
ncbi:unnamed protein product [Tenebrio molitor]|nr:unnamed protein product [Tenebrio molitor]